MVAHLLKTNQPSIIGTITNSHKGQKTLTDKMRKEYLEKPYLYVRSIRNPPSTFDPIMQGPYQESKYFRTNAKV